MRRSKRRRRGGAAAAGAAIYGDAASYPLGGGLVGASARDGPMGHRRETRSKRRGMRWRRLAVYMCDWCVCSAGSVVVAIW
jgi:hypothetical protein